MTHENPISESSLLQDLRRGSESAFEALYRRYSGRIYANLIKLLRDKEAAQELLQEIFVKIWESHSTIRISTSFSGYLYATSRHMVYNHLRHALVVQKAEAHVAAIHADTYENMEQAIERTELEKIMKDAIDALPPQRRRVYRLCKVEGKSYDEVSRLLGISTSTVNDHIVKATRFLRTYVSRSGHIAVALAVYYALSVN